VSSRFPIRDQIAFAGVGTTQFSRHAGKSDLALVLEACQNAIADAGIKREEIDGIVGTMMPVHIVQGALGIPELTYFTNCFPTFPQQIIAAMNAVYSGACETVLVYHNVMVSAYNSKSAAADPFRIRAAASGGGTGRPVSPWLDDIHIPPSYSSWANRYFHEYPNARREHLGMISINSRTNGVKNDHAVLRTPISMDDYLAARMVRGPLFGMLDMDYPVDGADAFIITSAERAKSLQRKPVYIHAASLGQSKDTVEENLPDINYTAHQITMKALWERSELTLDDIELFQPYDGFTFICMKWFENVGYCGNGEAPEFLEDNFDKDQQRFLINGRVPVNSHGGSIADGATQGSGHTREAVLQLQGMAGSHQIPDVKSVLIPAGGFFMYTGGLIFRAD
jgi:acetyl-CoA acetyltransferase